MAKQQVVTTQDPLVFSPTNGRGIGALGLGLCAVIIVVGFFSGDLSVAVPMVVGGVFFAVLLWAALLRPAASASREELRLKTMFLDIAIPLASVESVVVRRFLVVRAGGNRYICPAISRSLRRTVQGNIAFRTNPFTTLMGKRDSNGIDYPDFVEEQIERFANDDRARRGIEKRSEEEYALGAEVRRTLAWPWIIALLVLGVGFVLSLFL